MNNIFKSAGKSFAKASKDVQPGTYSAHVTSIIMNEDHLFIYADLEGVGRVKIQRWFNTEDSLNATASFLRNINAEAVDTEVFDKDAFTGCEFVFIQNEDRTHRAARIDNNSDGKKAPSEVPELD